MNADLETQLQQYGKDLESRYRSGRLLVTTTARGTGTSRGRAALAVSVALFVVLVGGVSIWAATGRDDPDQAAPTTEETAAQSDPSATGLQVEYQGRNVGHIRPEDLSRIQSDPNGKPLDPFYPNIGFPVYDDTETLVGYATPQHGFVPLDEVDRYKADPGAFPADVDTEWETHTTD